MFQSSAENLFRNWHWFSLTISCFLFFYTSEVTAWLQTHDISGDAYMIALMVFWTLCIAVPSLCVALLKRVYLAITSKRTNNITP